MKRLLALMLCAASLGVMGQNGACCDLDGVNYNGPAVCLGAGEPNGTWSDADGVACDPDCSNYDPCNPAGECYNPNSPGCTTVGCTNPSACNYDPTAVVNDGSCEYLSCSGCQDPAACDYDEDALIPSICDYDSCAGCTNPEASNYDATALIDDGSCEILGCTIPQACNFDTEATVYDGSCEFESCINLGCTDPNACTYDPDAIVLDDSCIYPSSPCDDGDDMTMNDVIGDDCNCSGVIVVSVTFTVDMNLISQVSDQGVYIAGTFQGWDAETTMLTDNGDGTWSTTLNVSPGYHEFKFINGMGWNGGEEQMGGTPCSGNLDGGNRGAEFDAGNNTYTACFNICPEDPCIPDPPPAYITFQIDVSESDLSGESIFLFGSFTGWQGGAIEMADNGDGTWQTSELVSGSATVNYLYSIGYPVGDNEETGLYTIGLDSLGLDSTNFEVAGCGVPNGFGGFNRRFIRSGENEIIPLHCFNSCAGCNGEGCTDPTACNYDSSATLEDGTCSWNDECGVCGGQGIAEGDCDCDGNQVDAVGVCGGGCLSDYDGNGVCDALEAYGCTYEGANNFDPQATSDDGSCVFPCVGEVNANVFDWDGDYSVTVTDFLMMLTVFGDVDVDFDGVWDSADECIDTEACNYDADPSEPCQYIDVLGICGGGCPEDADADGVCDDVDECIGVVDECGVCNGPGATEVVIENITILYDSVYAEQIDTWFVFEVGADTTFSYQCDPSLQFSCGDPVSYQGYDYQTVQIGEQCWFAENLRAENYRNGDAIPSGLSDSEWGNTTSGAVAVYGEGSSLCSSVSPDGGYIPDGYTCDEAWSLNAYGRLYNWNTVTDTRNLCPSDWHVPSDEEWITLTDYLGESQSQDLQTTYGWTDGNNGTNASGFSGLPGGIRFPDGMFANSVLNGYWWSSSSEPGGVWNRNLSASEINRDLLSPKFGCSIRCIKDSE